MNVCDAKRQSEIHSVCVYFLPHSLIVVINAGLVVVGWGRGLLSSSREQRMCTWEQESHSSQQIPLPLTPAPAPHDLGKPGKQLSKKKEIKATGVSM